MKKNINACVYKCITDSLCCQQKLTEHVSQLLFHEISTRKKITPFWTCNSLFSFYMDPGNRMFQKDQTTQILGQCLKEFLKRDASTRNFKGDFA